MPNVTFGCHEAFLAQKFIFGTHGPISSGFHLDSTMPHHQIRLVETWSVPTNLPI